MKAASVLLLGALAVGALASSTVAVAGVRDARPNLVSGEILGRGIFLTANYERYFNNVFGVGAGLMVIGASGGAVTIVPLYVSVVPGDVHSPYLSAGVTLLGGGGSAQDWEQTEVFTASLGYQYQSEGGFFVRPLFTLLVPAERGSGDEYLIWPGVTIGGSF